MMKHKRLRNIHGAFPTIAIAMLTILLSGLCRAAPPSDADELLSSERWREYSYGISIRKPLDTVRLSTSQMPGHPLVHMACGNGGTISLYIRRADAPQTLEQVKVAALEQITFVQPSALILEEKSLAINDHTGALSYFRIPEKVANNNREKDPWVLGQAIIMIDEKTVALLQFDVDLADFDDTRQTFEAVVNSYEQVDPEVLKQERMAQIQRGKTWRESLTAEQIKAAMKGEQWYRIIEKDKDIGYMRITQRADRRLQDPGVRVDVQAHIVMGNATYDTLSNYFESDDNTTEAWSIRTTVRAAATRGKPEPQTTSWAETGLRAEDTITVNREDAQGVVKSHEWQTPAEGYMSQADIYLLAPLLRQAGQDAVSFYAYYSNAGTLSFRTETVEALSDGGYRVRSKPTLDHPEQITDYDATGQMTRRELPGGQLILPATRNYIVRKWQVK